LEIHFLACGSNASPAQLRRKLSGHGGGSVVPVIGARVSGVDVVYSAHMSSYGAIPATLVASPGTEVSLHITFLDESQLRLMDDTELNYARVRIGGNEFPLTLESGEKLSEYYAYLSTRGVLLLENRPVRLATIPGRRTSFQPATEEEVLSRVVSLVSQNLESSQAADVADFLDKVRSSQVSTSEISEQLRDNHSESNVGVLGDGGRPKIYREIASQWPGRQDREMLTVLPNYDRKPGDYALAVHPNVKSRLRLARYAVVENQVGEHVFSLIGAFSSKEVVDSEDQIRMDQTIRDAIGVKIRETVKLYPLRHFGGVLRRLIDILLPRKYLVMRVQTAHATMIERPGCLIPEIAMEILGVEPGDEVVLESAVREEGSPAYRLEEHKLRAYPTPADAQELREKTVSGMLQSRYPDCAEAFGVFPDLPWIFVDADVRRALKLGKCSPVRVRASRRYQLIKEFREFALLIVITLLSAISLLDIDQVISIAGTDVPANLLFIIPAVLLAAVLIFIAVRRRTSF
jgi:hypothetical protein